MTKLLQAILLESEADFTAMKRLFYESLKELNKENREGYEELVELVENREIEDEDALKRCKMISNR